MVKPQGCLILKWFSSVRYSFFVHSVFSLWAYSPISHFTVNLSSYGGFSEDSLGLSDKNFNHTTADICCRLLHWSMFFIEREIIAEKALECFLQSHQSSIFLFFCFNSEGLNTSLKEWHLGGRDCLGHKRFNFKNQIFLFYLGFPSWTVTLALL